MSLLLLKDKTVQTVWRGTTVALMAGQDGTDYAIVAVNPSTYQLEVSPISGTAKYAKIVATGSGDTEVVAAVTGKKIRVIAVSLVATTATAIKFRSATTDITGSMGFANNGGLTQESVTGLFETVAGAALNINSSAAVVVGGFVTYIEV